MLGAVMAGGRNTRYGGLKAFAEVGGVRIIDRVIAALRGVTDDVVVIANNAADYEALGLPIRSDDVPGAAALGGLLTALRWAADRNAAAVITVACDMPFVSKSLLEAIARQAEATGADICAPESGGRRGIEPLCAFYSTRCIPAIEAAIDRDDLRMIGFHADVQTAHLGHADVQRFGDPTVLFMNVNTPDELATAEMIAKELRS
jgi:molybdopterin-guanine dinucleotide biosynthesis protein A